MKRTGIFLFWLLTFIACEQQNQLDPQPVVDPTIKPDVISTTETGDTVVTKSMERFFPTEGIRAMASGPETMVESAERSATTENAASSLWFEPNAGAIWYESSTGKTHLLALQLPGGEPTQVKFASLGTGWGGATHMTMDRYNFYIVWKNSIYKVPKGSPNTWTKIVSNNGKSITGIAGFASKYNPQGFDFSRIYEGQKSAFYHYAYGTYSPLVDSNQNIITQSDVSGLALIRVVFYVGESSQDFYHSLMPMSPYDFSYYRYFKPQNSYSPIYANYNFLYSNGYSPASITGNPLTDTFFYSKPSILLGSPQIYELDGLYYSNEPFSYIKYSPSTAPLVVNNGYVWIMGNTLQRLMTLGSQRGKSNYNEYGWGGITLACADPHLVF
jgi:hypothetical protein